MTTAIGYDGPDSDVYPKRVINIAECITGVLGVQAMRSEARPSKLAATMDTPDATPYFLAAPELPMCLDRGDLLPPMWPMSINCTTSENRSLTDTWPGALSPIHPAGFVQLPDGSRARPLRQVKTGMGQLQAV